MKTLIAMLLAVQLVSPLADYTPVEQMNCEFPEATFPCVRMEKEEDEADYFAIFDFDKNLIAIIRMGEEMEIIWPKE